MDGPPGDRAPGGVGPHGHGRDGVAVAGEDADEAERVDGDRPAQGVDTPAEVAPAESLDPGREAIRLVTPRERGCVAVGEARDGLAEIDVGRDNVHLVRAAEDGDVDDATRHPEATPAERGQGRQADRVAERVGGDVDVRDGEERFHLRDASYRGSTSRGDPGDATSTGGTAMARIVVTGGSGKAGRAVVRDLLEHGHDVLNVDLVPSRDPVAPFLPADLTDLGQTIEALSGAEVLPGIEAVVHLAALPSPDVATPDVVFRTNVTSTHTVLSAAVRLGLRRVVWASSETTLGLPFDTPPEYAPVDEAHPLRPESSYSLSKVLGEEMARQFSRWSGIPVVGLRFSNIMERADYAAFPSYWDDPLLRRWNLWGYVDESHVAQACRRGLEADVTGADAFVIAAADTVMRTPSRELMATVFPGVPVRDDVAEHGTLLGIDRARRVLGYEPSFSWRELF